MLLEHETDLLAPIVGVFWEESVDDFVSSGFW